MKRREFIAGFGSAAAWPLAARAQQRAMPVVGVLDGGGSFVQFDAGDAAFASLAQQRSAALFLIGDAYFGSRGQQIVALASRHAIATCFAQHEDTRIGGLMSYSANRQDAARHFGNYVARILKGERPADLPVMQPTKFDLLINLKTARALGLEVPPNVLLLADEVIE